MAVLALGAAGAAIGGAIGGSFLGISAATIGYTVGSYVGNAIFNKAPNVQGPRLGDLRVTGTEYGQTVPWVAGSPRIAGQIIWASSKREIANTDKQGKGGGGGSVTTYTYEVDVAYLLSENEIVDVGRIWSNGELVGAADPDSNLTATDNWFINAVLEPNGRAKPSAFKEIRVYTGTDTQMPDSIIESAVGAGNCPAYRGRAYVVLRGVQLGTSGQLPNFTFEIGYRTGGGSPADYIARIQFLDDTTDDEIAPPLTFTNSLETGQSFSVNDGFMVLTGLDAPASSDGVVVWNGGTNLDNKLWPENIGSNQICYGFNVFGVVLNRLDIASPSSFGTLLCQITGNTPPGGRSINIYYRLLEANNPLSLTWYINLGSTFLSPSGIQEAEIGTGTGNQQFVFAFDYETNELRVYNQKILKAIIKDTSIGINKTNYSAFYFRVYNSTTLSTPARAYEYRISDIRCFRGDITSEDSIVLVEQPLVEVADQLMLRSGYSREQFNVSSIGDKVVRGLALSQVAPTRSAMELLQGAFFFEAAKDDTIRLFARKTNSVVTIPYADLGFDFGGESDNQLVLTNANDLELPAQISVQYSNMLADYQPGAEFSDRLLTEQESTSVVQLALGLLPIEAKEIADKMLADVVAGQWRFTMRLPIKYAYLMPGDVFEVVSREGRTFRGRIQEKKDSQVVIELQCVLDDVGTLDTNAATDANYISQTVVNLDADTEWEALDIPLLRDADNGVNWYAAVTPNLATATTWPGAVFVQSFGSAFTQLFTSGQRSAIGECDTVLGDWTHGAMFDETNTLEVRLYAGQLSSVVRSNMLLDQELNAAAVGVDGRWELIRFRNATLTGQDSNGFDIYRLSGLLRGQRGTEWAIPLHASGERFVLLDGTIRVVSSQLNELNVEREVKGVTFNTLIEDTTATAFTHTGVILAPFSVAQLRALPDGSDIDVTWNRRTRLSYRYGGINPVVPLGETTEAYRVWIYNGSTLVRTENVTTDSYTYTAANIASDGFVTSDTIRIEVAQVSATVGAGYIEEVEVTAP